MKKCMNKVIVLFFFFNDTTTTEIYTLSLHDALPISSPESPSSRLESSGATMRTWWPSSPSAGRTSVVAWRRSEEHTSELQSRQYLVCRPLLEKKISAPD